MSDYVISIIRTVVPIAVGYVVAWAAGFGVELDDGVLVPALTGVVSAIYYGLVRFLEQKWPNLGWLLGVAKTPSYEA